MSSAVRFGFSFVALASLSIVSASLGTAQQSELPIVRTTTRLVQLNVVVLDKQGHPVRGLSQDDFQVFDNDARQKIVHFSASADDDANEPVKRSPLVISNRQSHSGEPRGVTVILVDELILDTLVTVDPQFPDDPTMPIRQGRLAVLKFLATLKPNEQVALYALRREGVVVIHDFTDNRASLIAAAKSLAGGGPRGKTISLNGVRPDAARMLSNWSQNVPTAPTAPNGTQTFRGSDDIDQVLRRSGFEAIVEHLRGLPGRKNLVWISSTLPRSVTGFDPGKMAAARDANQPIDLNNLGNAGKLATEIYPDTRGHYEELRNFARWLSSANVSVYPMDANQLAGASSPPGAPLALGSRDVGQWSAAEMIASETGGRAIFDSNALDQHLQEIVAQTDASYQIGYYPGDKAWDGKYHNIQVKLARQGLTVLCRKGYYAKDDPLIQNWDLALRQVARSPVESPGIAVTLNVTANPLKAGPEDVVVKLDVRDIHFDQIEDRSKATLDVAFVQLGKDGRVLGGIKDRVALALLPETYSDAETQGWFYPRSLWIEPKTEKVRVVVRDISTGAVGSVSVPVEFLK